MEMDRRKKLLSAIAAAGIVHSLAAPAHALAPDPLDHEELYQQCVKPELLDQERANACACFLDTFPGSAYASAVISEAVGLVRGQEDASCGGGNTIRAAEAAGAAEIY